MKSNKSLKKEDSANIFDKLVKMFDNYSPKNNNEILIENQFCNGFQLEIINKKIENKINKVI